MSPELLALLAVQADDSVIRGFEATVAAMAPQLLALDASRKALAEELARSEISLGKEQARQRQLDERIAEHRARHERTLDILNGAAKLKEAAAAAAQVESARRVLADDESELLGVTRRVSDLRTAVTAHRQALEALDSEQAEIRTRLSAERAVAEQSLVAARAKRAESARQVPPGLLGKYERVHARRRTEVVVALRADFSCGACDTAIPLQRRPAMASGTLIEPCEGCGVLLYAQVPAPA